jgi:hypothetical protein
VQQQTQDEFAQRVAFGKDLIAEHSTALGGFVHGTTRQMDLWMLVAHLQSQA